MYVFTAWFFEIALHILNKLQLVMLDKLCIFIHENSQTICIVTLN